MKTSKPITHSVSVRFTIVELQILRGLAAEQRIPFSTFLRQLVLTNERVSEKVPSGVGPVSDILRKQK